jgi:hypothetical protein
VSKAFSISKNTAADRGCNNIVTCTLWVNRVNKGSVCLQPLLGNGQQRNNGSDQCFLCGLLRG